MRIFKRKDEATAAPAYLFMFCLFVILVIIVFYLMDAAKFMTLQHHIDDAMTDAALAAMIIDENYYFETQERELTPVIRFKGWQECYDIYKDCLSTSIAGTTGFYYNFAYEEFILYELENGNIRITTFVDDGTYSTITQSLGSVTTPKGENVTKTSLYANVAFDLQSSFMITPVRKTRDIYCVFNMN